MERERRMKKREIEKMKKKREGEEKFSLLSF